MTTRINAALAHEQAANANAKKAAVLAAMVEKEKEDARLARQVAKAWAVQEKSILEAAIEGKRLIKTTNEIARLGDLLDLGFEVSERGKVESVRLRSWSNDLELIVAKGKLRTAEDDLGELASIWLRNQTLTASCLKKIAVFSLGYQEIAQTSFLRFLKQNKEFADLDLDPLSFRVQQFERARYEYWTAKLTHEPQLADRCIFTKRDDYPKLLPLSGAGNYFAIKWKGTFQSPNSALKNRIGATEVGWVAGSSGQMTLDHLAEIIDAAVKVGDNELEAILTKDGDEWRFADAPDHVPVLANFLLLRKLMEIQGFVCNVRIASDDVAVLEISWN